jgi:hypothetical protein
MLMYLVLLTLVYPLPKKELIMNEKALRSQISDGFSSAVVSIIRQRDADKESDFEITNQEHELVVDEITYYIMSSMNKLLKVTQ